MDFYAFVGEEAYLRVGVPYRVCTLCDNGCAVSVLPPEHSCAAAAVARQMDAGDVLFLQQSRLHVASAMKPHIEIAHDETSVSNLSIVLAFFVCALARRYCAMAMIVVMHKITAMHKAPKAPKATHGVFMPSAKKNRATMKPRRRAEPPPEPAEEPYEVPFRVEHDLRGWTEVVRGKRWSEC